MGFDPTSPHLHETHFHYAIRLSPKIIKEQILNEVFKPSVSVLCLAPIIFGAEFLNK